MQEVPGSILGSFFFFLKNACFPKFSMTDGKWHPPFAKENLRQHYSLEKKKHKLHTQTHKALLLKSILQFDEVWIKQSVTTHEYIAV